ncbi:MAG: hypothetical protein LBT60_03230 [Oscillospiraceae bacterium]|jgi:hypothetical protein|nr:hypothetical protein [Oscillospiraceae bacterium]
MSKPNESGGPKGAHRKGPGAFVLAGAAGALCLLVVLLAVFVFPGGSEVLPTPGDTSPAVSGALVSPEVSASAAPTPDPALYLSTAVTVGPYTLNPAQYNYYYVGQYNLFLANDMGTSSLTRDTPLGEQFYTEEMTWEDYFRATAENAIVYTYALSDAAQTAGHALTVTEEGQLAATLANLETYAANSDQTFEDYLLSLFGEGVTLAIFQEENRREALAKSYETLLCAGYEVSDADIQAAYNADSRDTDRVSYCYFPMMAAYLDANKDNTLSDAEKSVGMADAKARAEEMLAQVSHEDDFNALCVTYADPYSRANYEGDPAFAVYREVLYEEIQSDKVLSDWAFGPRTPGEKGILEGPDYYYVLYFIGRGKQEVTVADLRLLSFRPDSAQAGVTLTEAEAAEAYVLAEEMLAVFRDTDRSETAFAGLTDRTPASYTDISPGYFSALVDGWCFDPARRPGDCELIQEASSVYLFYFVRWGEALWKLEVRRQIIRERFDAYFKTLAPSFVLTPGDGFSLTQVL